MRMTFKSMLVLSLAGVFLVGSFMCCCMRHLVPQKAKSCCHKAAKANPVKDSCKDNCSVKSAETAKVFDLAPNAGVMFVPAIVSVFSLKPVHTIKPVFLNGPPGPVVTVSRYLLFHSLRI